MARVAKVSVDLAADASGFSSVLMKAERDMAKTGSAWDRVLAGMDSGTGNMARRIDRALSVIPKSAQESADAFRQEFSKLDSFSIDTQKLLRNVLGIKEFPAIAAEARQQYEDFWSDAVSQQEKAAAAQKAVSAKAAADARTQATAYATAQAQAFQSKIGGVFTSPMSGKSAEDSASVFIAAADGQRAAMMGLIDAADPTAARLRQIAKAQQEASAALSVGAITSQEHAMIISHLGQSAAHASRGYSKMGGLVQQAGYQISDVAAVAAAGGNAMATAGTQLGQFLGFLGPVGAIVGAAVTVLGLFATNMLKSGDATEDAADKSKLYEKAMGELVDLEKDYNAALRERQGLSVEPGGTGSIERRVTEARGRVATLTEGDSLSGKPAGGRPGFFSGLYSRVKERAGFGRESSAVEQAQADLRAATADQQAANDLAEAAGKERLQKTINDLNKSRGEESALMKMSEKDRGRAQAAMEAEQRVRDALAKTPATPSEVEEQVKISRNLAVVTYDSGKAEESSKQISAQIQALQFQEAQLSRTSREQAIYSALQTHGLEVTTESGKRVADAAAKLYDKTEAVNAAKEAQERLNQSEADAWDVAMKQTEARDKIAAGMNEEVADNERLIAALQVSEAEYERVAAAIDLVNQYKAAGVTMTAEEIANVDQVSARLGEQRAEMDSLKDAAAESRRVQADMTRVIGTATEDAILKAKSLREVLAGLLQDMARIAARAAITKPLEGIFGSLMSGAGPGLSNLYTYGNLQGVNTSGVSGVQTLGNAGAADTLAFTGGYATGTNNAPPGMAWVGERGPELMRFKGGEQVYPSGLSKQIAAASTRGFADGAFSVPVMSQGVSQSDIGGGGFSLSEGAIVVNAPGATAADAQAIALAVAQQVVAAAAPQIQRAAVQQSVGAVQSLANRGGSFAKSVGRR